MQDQKEIEEKFPFFTMLTSGGKDYFGIVQNQDNTVTSFYDYNKLGSPEEKKEFVSSSRNMVVGIEQTNTNRYIFIS